ncbi:MAG: phospholipase/carboxylesterase [Pedosphaera sp.]|nr:phospholipase/carboxylesterase [Pedosphaera sp.]
MKMKIGFALVEAWYGLESLMAKAKCLLSPTLSSSQTGWKRGGRPCAFGGVCGPSWRLSIFAGALIFVALTCPSAKAAETNAAASTNLSPHHFTGTIQADYLLFLPAGYDAAGTNRWPLILFLHGIGESGTNVWKTTVHGPAKYIEKHPDFPFIVVSPQCPVGRKWSDQTVLGVLDEVMASQAVDAKRVYLTGLSMGGSGTWSLATTYPERFAAVAPICGSEGIIGIIVSNADKKKAAALKRLPIWAFQNEGDDVVPREESQHMVDALKKFGNKGVKFTVYPQAGHNSWTQTYDNPELYQWFLEHERSSGK